MNDPINPSHYKAGKVETIDCIESMIAPIKDPVAAYLTGQALKYLARWSLKNGVEDCRKARWYLNRLIEHETKPEPEPEPDTEQTYWAPWAEKELAAMNERYADKTEPDRRFEIAWVLLRRFCPGYGRMTEEDCKECPFPRQMGARNAKCCGWTVATWPNEATDVLLKLIWEKEEKK